MAESRVALPDLVAAIEKLDAEILALQAGGENVALEFIGQRSQMAHRAVQLASTADDLILLHRIAKATSAILASMGHRRRLLAAELGDAARHRLMVGGLSVGDEIEGGLRSKLIA